MAAGTIKKGTNYAAATSFFAVSQSLVEVAGNTVVSQTFHQWESGMEAIQSGSA
ncbi:hypothetical protein CHELA1G11_20924 [Hyphomicrobiales bacterium]|nr:hypothetical protein CHELA1G11_20924 [Hyphomicrobiales bacterium]